MNQKAAFEVLFDKGELTCFSANPYGVELTYGDYPEVVTAQFFSINPMHTRRLDANVVRHRNFLLEFDKIDLNKQVMLSETIPYSVMTYSGGKGYHLIISLAQEAEDRAEYDRIMARILAKVPDADKSCKNPSRFSRTPNAIRDNGECQSLINVRGRITRAELEAWLGPEPLSPVLPVRITKLNSLKLISASTNYFLAFGANEGTWNRQLFMATLDLGRSGYDQGAIMDKLEAVTGHLDKADLRTIASALKVVDSEAAE